ncbi:MAG: MoaD/ThiS family protein [Planctomycetota bacterium]
MSANSVLVEVLLFAGAAEKVGKRSTSFQLEPGDTIENLQRVLGQQYPDLEPLLGISRWAVNSEFVDSSYSFRSDMQIALIPPVSGG